MNHNKNNLLSLYFTTLVIIFTICGCVKQNTTQIPSDVNFGEKPYNYISLINDKLPQYILEQYSLSKSQYNYYISLDEPVTQYVSKDLYGWHGEIVIDKTPHARSHEDSIYVLIDYYINGNNIVFKEHYSSIGSLTKNLFAIGTLGLSQVVTGNINEGHIKCINIIERIKQANNEKKEREEQLEIEKQEREKQRKEEQKRKEEARIERQRQYDIQYNVPQRRSDAFKLKWSQTSYMGSKFTIICTNNSVKVYDISINKGNLKPTYIKLPVQMKYGNTLSFGVQGQGTPIRIDIISSDGITSFDCSNLFEYI